MTAQPWKSGVNRLSWCDKKSPCSYCYDYIHVTLKTGKGMKQSCKFRPKTLKKERGAKKLVGLPQLNQQRTSSSRQSKISDLSDSEDEDDTFLWIGQPIKKENGYFYESCTVGRTILKENDYVYLSAPYEEGNDASCYIGQIVALFEHLKTKEATATIRWLYRASETPLGKPEGETSLESEREIFASDDYDDNPISSIEGKCVVRHISQIDDLASYLEQKDHYYYSRWYSSGHFGEMQEPDSIINPYLDNLYDTYPLMPAKVEENCNQDRDKVSEEESRLLETDTKEKAGKDEEVENILSKGLPMKRKQPQKEKRGKEAKTSSTPQKKNLKKKEDNTNEGSSSDEDVFAGINPLTMIPCTRFISGPDSQGFLSQPFHLYIHSKLLIFIDLHSHLSTNTEVIGFLGGKWDPVSKKLVVMEAFPCNSIQEESDGMNVEPDPVSELSVAQTIANKQMRIVGWYHSHPQFPPDPSVRDIQTQKSYQALFRDAEHQIEPFIACINATFDVRLPTPQSVFNWFWVNTTPYDQAKVEALLSQNSLVYPFHSKFRNHLPMSLSYTILFEESIPPSLTQQINELIELYHNNSQQTNFEEIWRQDHSSLPSKQKTKEDSEDQQNKQTQNGSDTTKLSKLKMSLLSRLLPPISKQEADAFVEQICQSLVSRLSSNKELTANSNIVT